MRTPVEKTGRASTVGTGKRPRAQSEADAQELAARRRVSTSKNYQPKVSVIRNLESTPHRFSGPLCPLNLKEQKERFLRYGITPHFVMRSSSDSVEKLAACARGQIRFTYLAEARAILEAVKNKYGDGSAFVQEMFGDRIDEQSASKTLARYLSESGLNGEMTIYWTPDLSCSAKMMWHGPCQRYNKPEARKYTLVLKNSSENYFLREVGITCLANHEIGTHYFRMVNDGLQPWFSDRQKFQLKGMSCRESVSTEEGLATINTVLQARAKYLWTSAILYYTACMAAEMSFRELFDHLASYMLDKEQRWKHVMRVKRGLKNPGDRGGYGNDQCYFEGAVEILRNLDKIDFQLLYSGRMCIDELNRVHRLARMDCVKLPSFLKDVEKYKRSLREIAIINGLIPKPERRNTTKRQAGDKKRHRSVDQRGNTSSTRSCSKQGQMPFTRSHKDKRRSRANRAASIVDEPRQPVYLPGMLNGEDKLATRSSSNSQLASSSRQSPTAEVSLSRPKAMPNRIAAPASGGQKETQSTCAQDTSSGESFGFLDRGIRD